VVTEAIVLAGGLGTRLRGALRDLPKAMAPIAGRPFLAHLLQFLKANDVHRVVLAVGYRHEAIIGFFGSRYAGLELVYSVETEPLGTGGALVRALPFITATHALVLNGDTFFRIDYRKFQALLDRSPRPLLTVALRKVPDASRYGAVGVTNGIIQGFSARGSVGPGLINGGSYLVARDIFERYPVPPKFSWEVDFLQARVNELQPLAIEFDAPFIDIGIPEALAEAQTLIPEWVSTAV